MSLEDEIKAVTRKADELKQQAEAAKRTVDEAEKIEQELKQRESGQQVGWY